MNTLKFTSSDLQQQHFAEAVRKNVNDYFKAKGISTKANASMVIQTFIMLAMYITPFMLVLTLPMSPWTALLMAVCMGIGVGGVGMAVMHDAAHGAYSEKAWINNLLAGTIFVLGGNAFNWKIQHNVLHHAYTNIDQYDPDILSKGPIRFSQHAPLLRINRYQYIHAFFFYGFMTILKLFRDFIQMAQYIRAGFAHQFHLNPASTYITMVAVKAIYFSAIIGLPIIYTPFTWWQVLVGFFVLHWTTSMIIAVIFQLAHVVEGLEHPLPKPGGIIENDWAVHEVETTSDFATSNRLVTWYTGGLNFQIEHHLFPHICHVHYKDIAPIVEKTAREYGLRYEVKPTFMAALRSHIRRLKELGSPLTTSPNQAMG